ncbi:MAG: prolipoprotein diacylglyceryl transferase [Candidatus Zixiibacteriota bacterium]|jgi:phosphatidylglycerol:prolipoprotein diacylglycerol transferase
MWPTLIKIGDFEIGTFGLMAALAFLAAFIVFRAEVKRRGLPDKFLSDILIAGLVGGVVGARANFIIEHWDAFVLGPWGFIWSRYGFTWYGGVLGGALAVILVLKLRKQPLGPYADAVAPALALGYVFGRCGCQLSGDGDYGIPSDLPWAMAYPDGIVPTTERVHPTPVYEIILFLAIFFVLMRLGRLKKPPWWLFGVYLILAGVERFPIEFIRTNDPAFLGLTEAQLVSVAMFVGGIILVAALERKQRKAERENAA